MSGSRVLTLDECKVIKCLYLNDYSVVRIASMYFVSTSTIYRILKQGNSLDEPVLKSNEAYQFVAKQQQKSTKVSFCALDVDVELVFDSKNAVLCTIKTNKQVRVDVKNMIVIN